MIKMSHTQKNTKITFLAVLLIKLFVLIINLVNMLLFTEEKMLLTILLGAIFEEYDYCKKVMKKHFNRDPLISAEEEEKFQLTNSCWICDKLFDVGDEKVRGRCHITGK